MSGSEGDRLTANHAKYANRRWGKLNRRKRRTRRQKSESHGFTRIKHGYRKESDL